ncbi:MAG: winged helix-turn-helix transcriptional regulator, partial [Candidatus Heimdallarchaeota archaeon]
ISKKWAFLILRTISNNEHARFNEIQELLQLKISPRTLSTRLKDLERNNLIIRTQYQNEIPPRVEYSITAMGLDLRETIGALNKWAYKWNFILNSS